ncbi:hypothetical protein PTKIN_Ptkin01aG0348300 [Pterospermum kingtungense]
MATKAISWLIIFISISALLLFYSNRITKATDEPVPVSSVYKLSSHDLPYKLRVVSKRAVTVKGRVIPSPISNRLRQQFPKAPPRPISERDTTRP